MRVQGAHQGITSKWMAQLDFLLCLPGEDITIELKHSIEYKIGMLKSIDMEILNGIEEELWMMLNRQMISWVQSTWPL